MKHSLYHSDLANKSEEHLLEKLAQGYGPEESARLAEALKLALEARDKDDVFRPRGIDVAFILHSLKTDASTLLAALLADPWLRENLKEEVVEEKFGKVVAKLVRGVNWLNTFNEYTGEIPEPEQAELLRRMLLAVVDDVRAVLIKLAYRVQRLRTLKHEEEVVRYRIARETLDLFSPLANRLGVGQLKWELEDLAFRYLEPDEYKHLAKSLDANRAEREAYIHNFMDELKGLLKENNIQAKVYGRPKHLYSIFRKMKRKHLALNDLYDLLAVRVMVDKLVDCYAALGVVHSHWLHIPKEFDDYIANPKENGYQSLHTVVVGEGGRPVEIQIRTGDMHAFAEFGVAAHWRYKEGGKQDAALDRSINSLRRLLDSKEGDRELLDDFRSELFADEIFVLTPKGQVVRLKKGSTPLDFAYAIHSEVGHRCRGAKVNGRIAPLTYTLKSGEKVEILTVKQGAPSLSWLDPHMGYVATAHARGKIRQWFKQQDHEKHLRTGKSILERERHKLGIAALKDSELDELARHYHLPRADDLLLAIGRGDITPIQLAAALKAPGFNPLPSQPAAPRKPPQAVEGADKVIVRGIPNLLMHFAHCCDPTPGTPILGYVTHGHGVAIHATDCANVQNLPDEKQGRLIEVAWGDEPEAFTVVIEVSAVDRKGVLKDVTHVLSHEHISIQRTHTNSQDRSLNLEITVEVRDIAQLTHALDKISALPDVLRARRIL